jgi:hypothetical protein
MRCVWNASSLYANGRRANADAERAFGR